MINNLSSIKAQIVLLVIQDLFTDDDIYSVDFFCNGREQGYKLTSRRVGDTYVAFAEDRNTDAIVVYSGGYEAFELGSNVPTKYAHIEYFSPDEYIQAAKHVHDVLTLGRIASRDPSIWA